MNCPKCSGELKIAERQGIEIDYCNSCRGIWLDAGELDKIIDRSRPINNQQHSDYDSNRGRGVPHQREEKESWWEKIVDIFD